VVTPDAVVGGVGAVAEAVPPVWLVPYQFKVPPLLTPAVKGLAVWPMQSVTALATGPGGLALTVTTISDRALSQPFSV
jgi:hypothetical protein